MATVTAIAVGTVLAIMPSNVEAQEKEWQRFEAQHYAMGVLFKVVGYAVEETQAREATEAAFARIDQLNSIFSDYDPASESSRLVQNPQPQIWLGVSPDLHKVLTLSTQISRQSDGAFDITIGPLSQLWRSVRKSKEAPNDSEIETARSHVGHQNLVIHPVDHRVRLLDSGLRMDFGGVAKGYAADAALQVLAEHGITSALIDASGDISLGDPPPGRAHWFAEVAPLEQGGPPARRLALSGCAVATSGDAWQFVELNGKRFSHIIDPRSGWAIQGRHSVTVIAPTGALADAWASAVSVLGPQLGLDLVERTEGIEALFVVVTGDEVTTVESTGFAAFDAGEE